LLCPIVRTCRTNCFSVAGE
ncbi:Protein of unknown function, partial [Gryllus bimaculatus]